MMGSGTGPEPRPSAHPILGLGLIALAVAVVMFCAGAYAYYSSFACFQPADDEGFIMAAVQSHSQGESLYDHVASPYGPFYHFCMRFLHSLAGIPLTHDAMRFVTMAHWLAAALILALLVRRQTSSSFLALCVFFQCLIHMKLLRNEPGHPQGLAVVLMSALPLLVACWSRSATGLLAAAATGIVLSALLLTKINIGCLAAAALGTAVIAHSRTPRAMKFAAFLATAALPMALVGKGLLNLWALQYGVIGGGIVGGVLLVLAGSSPPANPPARTVTRVALAAFAAMSVAVVLTVLAETSFPGFLQSTLLQPLRLAGSFSVAPEFHRLTLVVLGASLLAACRYVFWNRSAESGGTVFAGLFGFLKVAYGFCGLFLLSAEYSDLLSLLGPFLWIVLVPPASDGPSTQGGLARTVLVLMASLQVMQGYPVYGSQAAWSTLLLLPCFAICLHDGFVSVTQRYPDLARVCSVRSAPRYLLPGLAVAIALAFFCHYRMDLVDLRAQYLKRMPLGLPGAARLRLPPSQVALYRWLTTNLRTHEKAILTYPGMNSLHFWTGIPPLSSSCARMWNMTLLDDAQQQSVVAALDRTEGVCIVRHAASMGGLNDQHRPLVRYIRGHFTNALSAGGYDIMVEPKRLPQVRNTLLEGELSLDGVHDFWPLPKGLMRPDARFVLSIRIRTTRPGVILGMQDGEYPLGQPAHALPLLFLGDDGHLNIAISAAGNAAGRTQEKLTDGAWHRIEVARPTAGAVEVYVDGKLARSVPGLPPSQDLEYAQLGAGYGRGYLADQTEWSYFAGRMADAHLLTGDQCGGWQAGGPP